MTFGTSAYLERRYPADFTGEIDSIEEGEVKQRWDWFRTTFLELAEAKLRPEEAYVLWRAFEDGGVLDSV